MAERADENNRVELIPQSNLCLINYLFETFLVFRMIKLKQAVLLSLLFFLFQTPFAQTKIAEYGRITTDAESSRMDNLVSALSQEPDSKGLIIIYSGKNNEGMGSILRHIEGVKDYLSNQRGVDPERIFFSVKDGRNQFSKELWVYPKYSPLPELKSVKLDLSNLTTKYLYASICTGCEPSIPSLSFDFISLESYANLLKEYPSYKGLIIIYPSNSQEWNRKDAYKRAVEYVIDYRKSLTKEYKINPKRISIRIAEPNRKNSLMMVDFYIVPNKNQKAKTSQKRPFLGCFL